MNPGDACLLLGHNLVKHVAPCPQAGRITDVRTGEVVTGRLTKMLSEAS